jgi:Ser/Thr protein kinase RdoA (MazF antagonist)
MPPHPIPSVRSRLAVEGLASLLEVAYGLAEVRCQLIKGTIRDTYQVTSRGGSNFILSVYPHSRPIAEIVAELDLLDLLAAGGVLVAPAVRQRTGERLLAIEAPEGMRHAVCFEYIFGRHLDRQPAPEPARHYGRAIAHIHVLTDGMPQSLTRPPVDVAQMIDDPLRAFAAVVTDRPADVAYLREVALLLHSRIATLPLDPPGFGLVHGDVIPSNAQVTPAGKIAVLDFDFCGDGWRAYDVATYLGEVRFWSASPAAADGFLAGYEEVRTLLRWEREALPLFEAARHIHALGTPALRVNEWGRSYLSDRMIDILLDGVRACMAEAG